MSLVVRILTSSATFSDSFSFWGVCVGEGERGGAGEVPKAKQKEQQKLDSPTSNLSRLPTIWEPNLQSSEGTTFLYPGAFPP